VARVARPVAQNQAASPVLGKSARHCVHTKRPQDHRRSFKRFKSTKRTGDTAGEGGPGLIFRHSFRQTSNCIAIDASFRFGLSIVSAPPHLNSRDNADYRMMTPRYRTSARWQRRRLFKNTAQASGLMRLDSHRNAVRTNRCSIDPVDFMLDAAR